MSLSCQSIRRADNSRFGLRFRKSPFVLQICCIDGAHCFHHKRGHALQIFGEIDSSICLVAPVAARKAPRRGPFNINDHFSKDALGIMKMVAGAIANTGANNIFYKSEPVLAMGPEHAKTIAEGGFSKRDLKHFLFEHARIPIGRFSDENIQERILRMDLARYTNAPPDLGVPVVQDANDLIVIVLGGAGKHSMFLPTFGATRAVTRPLKLADGRFARSIEDFRAAHRGPTAE
jgi:hypothetical protein